MKRFWCIFFMFWPILAVYSCWIAPERGWWFPGGAMSPLGQRIDDLFSMILVITTVTFIGTQIALGYVLWTGARRTDPGNTEKAWFSHGSHNLEVMWTIVPAGILVFIALYQMDVWKEFRVRNSFPAAELGETLERVGTEAESPLQPLAEVTARQFEWRIRYAGFDEHGNLLPLQPEPQPTDLYAVNDLHLPSGTPVMITLRTQDVQHSFFLPELRIKQDAVPGLSIPVWFETQKTGTYSLLCAELCGWGHYKMKARLVTQTDEEWLDWLRQLHHDQNFDGTESADDPLLTDAE